VSRLTFACAATVILLLASAVPSAEPSRKPSLEDYLQKLGYGVIPLERTKENKLFVRAELNGKSHALMVDTGWSVTALDSSLAGKFKTPKELGVSLEDSVLGTLDNEKIVLLQLKLGAARFENQPAEPTSLKAQGQGISGVLGCDFMIRNHAILDCAAKRLYVRAGKLSPDLQEVLKKTLSNSGYHLARLKRSQDLVPICSVRINETPVDLIVDSGGVWTLIDDSTARKLKLRLSRTGYWIEGVKRGMRSEILTTPVKNITVDGAQLPLRGILVGVGDLKSWTEENSTHAAEGILGAELLAQSSALIDFQATNMWFVPDAPK